MNKTLKIENHFFDAAYCKKIIQESQAFEQKKSKVGLRKGGTGTRLDSRKSFSYKIPDKYWKEFEAKIINYIPTVEATFGFKVDKAEAFSIRLLAYDEGHYFKPHRDIYEDGDYPTTRKWKVTGVIYLNEYEVEEPSEGNFSGGEFLVYGLNPESETLATPVLPETGQFVLFNSTLVHEVLPIRAGRRYCITTWYS